MAHLQIRDIPDRVHSAVRQRAKGSGVSMREYVLRLIEQDLGRQDTNAEMVAKLTALPKAHDVPDIAALISAGRAERDAEIQSRIGHA